MIGALGMPAPARSLNRWQQHLSVLIAIEAVLLIAFHHDVGQLAHIWWTSTTFGHCLFILPVLGWLVWMRRREVAALTPQAWWPALSLVAGGGLTWLIGDAASVAVARQIGLLMMVEGAVVTLLGPWIARGLLFPLCYAAFLIPIGTELERPLQEATVAIVMPLLKLVGLAASSNGVLIHAGRYHFEVAEACSGAKFVIAMVAFGVLVANLCFVSWTRRALFLVAAVVVPVVANGLRAFATIWAADIVGLEAAAGFDHIVYGWLFFALVMAAVLAIGWRWFDRAPDAAAFDPAKLQRPPRSGIAPTTAAACVLATAALFPAWSAIAASREAPLPTAFALPQVPGWTAAPPSRRAPWQPHYPGAGLYRFGRYVHRGQAVDMAVAVYGQQRDGHELIGFGNGVLREEDRWVRIADDAPVSGGKAMRITAPGPVERVVVTWYRVNGMKTTNDWSAKLAAVTGRLAGGGNASVAIHLSAEVDGRSDPRRAIADFVEATGGIDRIADRAAGVR